MIIDTGPGHTQPGINDEQGIVGRALDKGVLHIEKLVFQPFKGRTGMRATIDESIKPGILVNNENTGCDFPVFDKKALTARVRDFRSWAKRNGHSGN